MADKLTGRAAIEAELKRAAIARDSLESQAAGINREIAKWDTRMEALEFALEALPEPAKRGRKAANGAAPPLKPRKKRGQTTLGDDVDAAQRTMDAAKAAGLV